MIRKDGEKMVLVWYPEMFPPASVPRHGWMSMAWTYTLRDIKEENPNAEELRAWHEKAACPSGVFSTSGLLYKAWR